jgi:YVTN family beta-propeller protein
VPTIFISYRRRDSAGHTGHLYDELSEEFGRGHVFRDLDSVPAGQDFVTHIETEISGCDTVVVVIGPEFLTAGDIGRRRLDDPGDHVRAEVEAALASGAEVFPVLVAGAEMPDPDELPDSIKPLARRNAIELSDSRWRYDVNRLIRAIRESHPGGLAARVAHTVRDAPAWAKLLGLVALAGVGVAVALALRGSDPAPPAPRAVGTVASRTPIDGDPTAIATGAGRAWVTTREGALIALDSGKARPSRTVRVGGYPTGVVVGLGQVWVVSHDAGLLHSVDTRTGKPTGAPIRVGAEPLDVAIGEGAVWVVSYLDGSVIRVDPSTRDTRRIDTGRGPTDVAVGAGSVWVTNYADGTVSRINPSSRRVIETIVVGNKPESLVVRGGTVWVALIDTDKVVRIDAASNTVVPGSVRVGNRPDDLALWNGAVYVVNQDANNIMRIDPDSAKREGKRLDVGNDPAALAGAPGSLWVANLGEQTVTRVKP